MRDDLRFLKKELERAISKFEEVDHSTAIGNMNAEEIALFWLQETSRHPARGTISYIRLYWLGEIRRLRSLITNILASEDLDVPRKPNALSRGEHYARRTT